MSASSESSASRERRLDEEFRAFLNSDRSEEGLTAEEVTEARAKRYLEIQTRLERLFAWRGCHEAVDLAREALDRAKQKWVERRYSMSPSMQDNPNPVGFVCSFVRYIHLEWLAKQAQVEVPPHENRSVEDDIRQDCLDDCMSELLDPEERELILAYYQDEKGAKITHRKKIAERRKVSPNALRLECFRIRERLRSCVVSCVEQKQNRIISPI